MPDDLTTPSGVDAVLAATSAYDINASISEAQRYAVAMRRKIHFVQSTSNDGQSVQFSIQAFENQLQQCLAWLSANGATPTDAQLLANPAVTHADFSTFRGYASS